MNISKITYSVEAVIPHPEIAYANMKPHVTAEMDLLPGDDEAVAKEKLKEYVHTFYGDAALWCWSRMRKKDATSQVQTQVSSERT